MPPISTPHKLSRSFLRTIIEKIFAGKAENTVIDIALPPGGGKTYNIIEYIVEKGRDAIMTFPYHQNQQTALQYIFQILHESRSLKLKQFIFDYAGLENYCIFYKPELLMKLLDKFRREGETYTDAVQNMLSDDMLFRVILAKGVDIEHIWMTIGRSLDEYKSTGDKKKYLSVITNIVERKGQYEICTNVCPLGLFAWWYRKEIYNYLSDYKIITWRDMSKEAEKYKTVKKFLVYANPSVFVENIDKLRNGEFSPEWVLCPRYLIMTKSTMNKRVNRPTFITTRRVIILTPHAGLDFILNLVRKQLYVSKIRHKEFLLFIDEYDYLLYKPISWSLLSIEAIKTVIAVADKIINTTIGDTINGIEIDEYVKRYAEYVKDTLTLIYEIFEESTETKTYNPLVNIFVEGAFSEYRETLPSGKTVIYKPLGARVVHIRHFMTNPKASEVLKLVLNPKSYFQDLAEEDPDWILKYREALIKFRLIIKGTKTLIRSPAKGRTSNEEAQTSSNNTTTKSSHVLYLTMKKAILKDDPIKVIQSYLIYLLDIPRYVVFYTYDNNKIRLNSIDIRLHQLLTWSRSAILSSATPIIWNYFILGPNPTVQTSTEYERVVYDKYRSFIHFDRARKREYDTYTEYVYKGKSEIYNPQYRTYLLHYIHGNRKPEYTNDAIKKVEIEMHKTEMKTEDVYDFVSRIEVHVKRNLDPINLESGVKNEIELVKQIKKYIGEIRQLSKTEDGVLVLAQNKRIAKGLAKLYKGIKCLGTKCDDSIPEEKISHYLAKNGKIIITYFRSRSTRGIDIPHKFTGVIIVGSPNPRASTFACYISPSDEHPLVPRHYITYKVMSYNSKPTKVYLVLTPQDFLSGISELMQSIGRAVRMAMKSEKTVKVIIPEFLIRRIKLLSPYWFKLTL